MGAFSRKRLRERFITFASAVYNVCIRGCKRYPWRTHVFAFKVDQIGPGGCSALQGRMQCTAGAVAVHCGGGCSALRLRWAKLAPKSSVLFWTREKGGETRPIWVTVAPPDLSTEPAKCLYTSIMIVETLVLSDSVLYPPLPHNAT